MTQADMFWAFLVTAIMWISGIKELLTGKCWLGAVMMVVPVCGWASLVLGK